jgi:hypothetical protein
MVSMLLNRPPAAVGVGWSRLDGSPTENVRSILMRALAALCAALCLSACAKASPPPLARYLEHAEIQAETDAQRAELNGALGDLVRLEPAALRTKKYGPDQQPLPAFLRAHLVPAEPVAVEDEEFYTAAGNPQVRTAVAALQTRLRN